MLFVPNNSIAISDSEVTWDDTIQPSTTMWTDVLPGTSGYGSWVQLGTAAFDAYGFIVQPSMLSASGQNYQSVYEIGVDLAGGSSYTAIISNVLCGGIFAWSAGSGCSQQYCPFFISAGATIAIRMYSDSAISTTEANIILLYKPINPSQLRMASYSETIGVSGKSGTAVTVNTSEGSWTLIGTTTKDLWWFDFHVQVDDTDTSWNTQSMCWELAVGDASNKHIIIPDRVFASTTAENTQVMSPFFECEYDVPAGSNLYVRGQVATSADTGYNVGIVGLGG